MKNFILPVRFGLITSAVLIAYFLILALVDKHTNPVFSFLNAAITAFGIFETIRYYKLEQGDSFTYSNGFIAGLLSGFIATVVFTIFFLLYITEINGDFVSEVLSLVDYGTPVSVGVMTFVVGIMGVATTVISAFTVMQYFKKSWNIS
ncbi:MULTISPECIES: DUF4199 domain-containing protein [Bizionia]|uniref:DUF4199 domain-containing protein n=1 Tax=Bizionia algoritergicola TaxID=291187 RepID=A0A5D0R2D6_9FLAO|nr:MULTISPECIES: DUF4199 domain-containing protein [Bizionia]OBX21349.1 hypothetical protein BAA08_13155 [Bizionia sp. APA-3]TYB74828.1 DUF4199 domain-containing protein [Bizionia algoritergicola]